MTSLFIRASKSTIQASLLCPGWSALATMRHMLITPGLIRLSDRSRFGRAMTILPPWRQPSREGMFNDNGN